MHASAISDDSAKFRQAVSRGDASEALRLGRRIMYACQQQEVALGQQAVRSSWSRRLGHWCGRRVDTHEIAHYRSIKENVALALHAIGLDTVDSAPALPLSETHRLEPRSDDIQRVHQDLNHVSALYTTIASLINRASPMIDAFTARIDDLEPSFDRANDAILQYYVDRPQGPSYLSTLLCTMLVVTLLLIFAT